MDLAQLRKQAKELKAAVTTGDADAVARVLAHHPKLAGRDPQVLSQLTFTLRDAQATLAREYSYDGWQALLDAHRSAEPDTPRWPQRSGLLARAFAQARRRGDTVAAGQHVLLALLDPPVPTIAQQVLQSLGATVPSTSPPAPTLQAAGSTTSSIPLHALDSFAAALALAEGLAEPTDEHVLTALVFEHRGGSSTLVRMDLDPDEVYDALVAQGVSMPALRPPTQPSIDGPYGPRAYVPDSYANEVCQRLLLHHPPGSRSWRTNVSRWKPGWVWFDAEDDIDLANVVRTAVGDDETLLHIVALSDAIAHEHRARDR